MNENEISFRLATSSDIEALVNLVNNSYRGDSGKKGWTTESDLLGGQRTDSEMMKETINDTVVLLLLEKNAIAACVNLKVENGAGYIGMLTVSVDHQKKGFGDRLLKAAENFIRDEWKKSKVVMTVITLRSELIQWYVRRGYKQTGEKKPFPYGNERFGIPLREDLEFEVLSKNL